MTRRVLHNTPEALAEYQIAGLAFLQDVVVFTARVLGVTYPDIYDTPRRGDHAELTSARQLLESCGHLLNAIKEHRRQTAVYLPDGHPAKNQTDEDDDDDDLF
jgi:hypothetical protein